MPANDTARLIASLELGKDTLSPAMSKAEAGLTAFDKKVKQTGTSLGGLGTSVSGIAKAGAAAFVAFKAVDVVSDFFAAGIKGAREEEVGIARLTASLKANVPAWDQNIAAVERAVSARTAAAFADDELRESLGSLVVATHNVNDALDLQSTAMDLARFRNISLTDATAELIKVQAGSFRSLRSLGIETKGVTTATEALARIREAVAGQSAAFLETDAGKAEALRVSVDELSESFGRFAVGPIGDASEALANFFNILSGTGDKFKTQGENLAAQTAEFVKTATIEQLKAAREGVAEQLAKADNPFEVAAGAAPDTRNVLAQLDAAIAQFALGYGGHVEDMGQTNIELQRSLESVAQTARDTDAAAAARWMNAVRDTGAGLDNIAARARAAAADLDITTAISNVTETAEKLPPALRHIGADSLTAMADGIRSQRRAPLDAFNSLVEALKTPLTQTQETARLIGELTSKELAAGLKSADPELRAQARAVRETILERLEAVKPRAGTLGKDAMDALAAGLRSKDGVIRQAALSISQTVEAQLALTNAKVWGQHAAEDYAEGFASREDYLAEKTRQFLAGAGHQLVAASPPKAGPLKDIGKWGQATSQAWADGFASTFDQSRLTGALDRISGGIRSRAPVAGNAAPISITVVSPATVSARDVVGGPTEHRRYGPTPHEAGSR